MEGQVFKFLNKLNTGRKMSGSALPTESQISVAKTVHQFIQYTIDEFGYYGLIGQEEFVALEAYENGAIVGILEGAFHSTNEVTPKEIEIAKSVYAQIACNEPVVILQYAKVGVEITPSKKMRRLREASSKMPEFEDLGLMQARQLTRHFRGDPNEPDYGAFRQALAEYRRGSAPKSGAPRAQ